jgi:hypothetical protein
MACHGSLMWSNSAVAQAVGADNTVTITYPVFLVVRRPEFGGGRVTWLGGLRGDGRRVVRGFVFCGRDIADGGVDPVVVVPADPAGDVSSDLGSGVPGEPVDELGLEGACAPTSTASRLSGPRRGIRWRETGHAFTTDTPSAGNLPRMDIRTAARCASGYIAQCHVVQRDRGSDLWPR